MLANLIVISITLAIVIRFVWTHRSPTVPDRGRDRQRARLGGRVSEATGRSDYRSEPAVKRAESTKGSTEWILEIERVRFLPASSLKSSKNHAAAE